MWWGSATSGSCKGAPSKSVKPSSLKAQTGLWHQVDSLWLLVAARIMCLFQLIFEPFLNKLMKFGFSVRNTRSISNKMYAKMLSRKDIPTSATGTIIIITSR